MFSELFTTSNAVDDEIFVIESFTIVVANELCKQSPDCCCISRRYKFLLNCLRVACAKPRQIVTRHVHIHYDRMAQFTFPAVYLAVVCFYYVTAETSIPAPDEEYVELTCRRNMRVDAVTNVKAGYRVYFEQKQLLVWSKLQNNVPVVRSNVLTFNLPSKLEDAIGMQDGE